MGKFARTKGSTYENEVCKDIHPFWAHARRNLAQYQGADGRDLDSTEPVCMQLKRRKKITLAEIKTAFVEANESTDAYFLYPMVIWRDDRDVSKVMMNLEDLIELLCGIEDGNF